MNERIRELAEQARKYADENRPGSFVKYDPEWFVLYNEKFAELIVRECARVAFESDLTMAIGQWGADSAILKHFGVEE
jgi:hypothetical protein